MKNLEMSKAHSEYPVNVEERIFEITGIQPDSRYHIPLEETQSLISGVHAGDQGAMVSLVATRLKWAYDKYASQAEVRDRSDITIVDILGMTALASLEAARKTDPKSPIARTLLHVKIPRYMNDMLVCTKLVPSLAERSGLPLRNAAMPGGHVDKARFEDRIIPVGDRFDVERLRTGEPAIEPANIEDVVAEKHALESSMRQLSPRQRRVIAASFGLSSEQVSPTRLAQELGVAESTIRSLKHSALRKLCNNSGELLLV